MMTSHFEAIEVSDAGPVGIIELNDPQRLNPTDSHTTLAELNDALLAFGRNRTTRAVVIFGRGKAFSAGANLGDRRPARYPQDDEDSPPSRLAYGYAYGQMWETLHGFKKPLMVAETVRQWMRGDYRVFRSEATRKAFVEFVPALIDGLARAEEPDSAVTAFDRFLQALQRGGRLPLLHGPGRGAPTVRGEE